LIFDNPAERLLEILQAGQSISKSVNCRTAWKQILSLEKDSTESQLMSCLGKIMDLPNQSITLLDSINENDNDSHKHWVKQVSKGFSQQNLNANWASFIDHIDAHSIGYLKLCSRLLKAHSAVNFLSEDQLESIKSQIQELIVDVNSSDLELPVKQYLVRSLQRIIVSIDEYFISGSVPIIEAIETTIGHTVTNKDFRDALKSSDIGEAIWEVLFKVSSVVSLSAGLPELAVGASAILLSIN
jgi:hypothetical protein